MKIIEIGDLIITLKLIEGVQFICEDNNYVIKIFMGPYGHTISFDDEKKARDMYELIELEMRKL